MQNYLDGQGVLNVENSAANPLPLSNDFQPLFFSAKKNGSTDGGTFSQGSAGGGHDSPQIELISLEGKIQRIVITCTCCKRIELECQY